MKIVPFEELREASRERYQERIGSVPEPRVINARALASLDAPRSFIWGGIGYWCPPLSYEDGFRLLVAANALRDLREGGDPIRVNAARLSAAHRIRRHVRSRRPFWRWTRAFLRDTPEEIEAVIRHLLYVEDDAPHVPTDRPVTVDLIDNLYTFQREFGRRPTTWADYVYGMRHIARAANREDLRASVAARMGVNAGDKGWRDYERELRQVSGW